MEKEREKRKDESENIENDYFENIIVYYILVTIHISKVEKSTKN